MGYEKQVRRWQSELCSWTLSVEDVTMKCTCNAFRSDIIGIFTDFTRTLGPQVAFPALPEPVVVKDETEPGYMVVPTDQNLSETKTNQAQDVKVTGKALNGTNFVWMGQTILIALLTLAGSLAAWRLDKADENTHGVMSRTAPIPVAK